MYDSSTALSPYAAIAQRIANAYDGFAASLVELGGLSIAEARTVTRFYVAKKLAKVDAVGGTINVKHGAYLDPDVLRRAVVLAGKAR